MISYFAQKGNIPITPPRFASGKTVGKDAVSWYTDTHGGNEKIGLYRNNHTKLRDPEAARRRLDFIKGITLVPGNEAIARLADIYFGFLDIPEQAKTDCSHVAVCVDSEIDYLLSWNCTHLGQVSYGKVYMYNQQHGLKTPDLLTPEVLMELGQEKNNELP